MLLPDPESFEALPGLGIRARVKEEDLFMGWPGSLENEGILISSEIQEKISSLETAGCSVILLAVGGRMEGLFVFEDELRPESKNLMQRLDEMGLNAVIVTGDNHAATQRVAEKNRNQADLF